MVAVTNVASVWNALGNLEFRQGEPGNATGPVLLRFNASNNCVDLQVATALSANVNTNVSNFCFLVKDALGVAYYIPAMSYRW